MRFAALTIIISFLLTGCFMSDKTETNETAPLPPEQQRATEALSEPPNDEISLEKHEEAPAETLEHAVEAIELINPNGTSLKERFSPPKGFSRTDAEPGSFAEFLQTLPLKSDGAKVKYFDGREKTRDVYMAVVDYTLGDRDLQQCADAVMRLRAEYLYSVGRLEEIRFNFVNGFAAVFSKWADGYGVSMDGNSASWIKDSRNDASYESFQRYLNIVYAYSGTLSLENELVAKEISELSIGDVFIVGGSPGHCVIIVDTAVDESNGKKLFMLAQSYMPAQDIQILKGNEAGTPWYSAEIKDKLITPEWVFEKNNLKTWQ